MVSVIRRTLVNKFLETVQSTHPAQAPLWLDNADKLAWCIRAGNVSRKSKIDKIHFTVPYKSLLGCGFLEPGTPSEHGGWAEKFTPQIPCGDEILEVTGSAEGLSVQVDPTFFNKALLHSMIVEHSRHGLNSCLHDFRMDKYGTVQAQPRHQKIVIEYSSPNIAKRFHAGHLRSTILGNFVGNIQEELGHKVIRINYLGDWGTQFGLLGVGFQEHGSMEKLKDNAMQHLFDIYVAINKEASSEENKSSSKVHREGMDFFKKMETGDPEAMALWQMCRSFSIEEYSKVYERLGVTFDEYHGEAMYFKKSLELLEEIKSKGLLQYDSDTGVGYVDLSSEGSKKNNKKFYANLVKSDGSTLYLTRDLAAAVDRKTVYNFDKMFYVVDSGQQFHFEQLFYTLRKAGYTWADDLIESGHVRFGRVKGMSTRRGEVVFLSDILDEAKSRMVECMKEKETTKITEMGHIQSVAEKLAVSAIIIQDLRSNRLKDYEFSWDRILNFKGESGVFLQYTHARLCSLERNCGFSLGVDCDTDALVEVEAYRLVQHLARFDEHVHMAHMEFEASYIVQYLFVLGRLINNALTTLQVKGEPADLAKSRLMLFHCAKKTLATGLRLVGIEPVQEM